MFRRVPRCVRSVLTPIEKRALQTCERLESGVSSDLTSRAVMADPYILSEQMRHKDSVHRIRLINDWMLTEYEGAGAVLQDHRRFSSGENLSKYTPYRMMLDLAPPDHMRLRSLVSKASAPRYVAALGPRIQQFLDDLLDALSNQERFDLIRDFAFSLPIFVIAEMLSTPRMTKSPVSARNWALAFARNRVRDKDATALALTVRTASVA